MFTKRVVGLSSLVWGLGLLSLPFSACSEEGRLRTIVTTPSVTTTSPEAGLQEPSMEPLLTGDGKTAEDRDPSLGRFLGVLQTVEDTIVASSAENEDAKDLALALSKSSLRQALFRFQILADLYSDKQPALKSLKRTITELEDRIGDVRFALQVLEDQNEGGTLDSDDKRVRELKKRLKKDVDDLAKHLKKSDWLPKSIPDQQTSHEPVALGVPRVGELRSELAKINWQKEGDEPNALLEQLCTMALELDAAPWDMQRHLDDKLGLHTLKKVLRKQRLQVGVLLDDILEKETEFCPRDQELTALVPALESMDAVEFCKVGLDDAFLLRSSSDSKRSCSLSSCYLDQIENLYRALSDAKDEGEALAEQGKTLSKKRRKEIQNSWEDFKTQGVLRKLALELVSCRVN